MILLITVITHYANSSYKNRTKLIAIKRLKGNHSEKNITALLIKILKEFGLKRRLGYFMTDNANSNDLCIHSTLKTLFLTLTYTERSQRRLRYYDHILNLACMAYFYGHQAESFETEHIINEILVREEKDLKAWKKFSPFKKIHNLIV
jgi:hypothetical protein